MSISDFTSLVGVPVGIASSEVRLKICQIAAGIKNYMLIVKKKTKMLDKIMLLPKTKLNLFNFLFPKALIDSYISHDKVVLGEYSKTKVEIKNPDISVEYTTYL